MIRKFLALPPAEKAMALEAALLLPVVSLLLRCVSLARLRRRLDPAGAAAGGDAQVVASASRMVAAGSRYGLREGTCLEKSIVLAWMLRRRGVRAELKIGCRREDDFEGHAWLEWNGVPINDSADVRSRYAVL